MAAPKLIEELIDKFDRDQEFYRSSQYNETELRTQFINPFFEALGWDVYHKEECRPDKRDVKEEDAIDVEGKTKNPDYSFRSQFSPDALDYVTRIEKKIVLIDGEELATLMIDYGIGVAADATYEIKRLDTDYFEEEL